MFSAVFLSFLLLFCSWNNQDGTRVQALRSMLRMQSPTNIAIKKAQLPLKIAIAGAGVGGTVYISSRYFSNLWLLPLPFFRTFYSTFPSSLQSFNPLYSMHKYYLVVPKLIIVESLPYSLFFNLGFLSYTISSCKLYQLPSIFNTIHSIGTFAGYALQNKGFDVTVFEKSKQFSRFGGPIQLASNALSCINALSPELFEQIMVLFLCIYFSIFFLLQLYRNDLLSLVRASAGSRTGCATRGTPSLTPLKTSQSGILFLTLE